MRASSITMAIILLLSLIVVALVGCGHKQTVALDNDRPRYLVQMIGFISTSYNTEGRVASVVAADDLVIRPRNYRGFNIRSLNEVVLTNVRIEEHLYDNKPDTQAGISLERDILGVVGKEGSNKEGSNKEFGLITRVVINKFELAKFIDKRQTILLKAEQASIGKKKHQVVFNQAVLEQLATGKRLISEKLIWDKNQDAFLIPGSYILQTSERQTQGHNVWMNLGFIMQPL
jgi:lipopolysaccharide export system protein LptC